MGKTVLDLIHELSNIHDSSKRVLVEGADCGGYDVCLKDDFSVTEKNGIVYVVGAGNDVDESGREI